MKVLILFGTRPEAIKLAPVIKNLTQAFGSSSVIVCNTGQHEELLKPVIESLDIQVHHNLTAIQRGMGLNDLLTSLVGTIDKTLALEKPEWVIVQGDTLTAFAGATAAFLRKVKVAHVEAGLRTYKSEPFPEEGLRQAITNFTTLHFAPTSAAASNLLKEQVLEDLIVVTGNTVIDALNLACEILSSTKPRLPTEVVEALKHPKPILVTVHRREAIGAPLKSICRAIKNFLSEFPDTSAILPLHLNPEVRSLIRDELSDTPKVYFTEPLGYLDMVQTMKSCYCILTDSGGIQEEAPTLGKPVIILRNTTERPEVVECGAAILAGTSESSIIEACRNLFSSDTMFHKMSHSTNPFGDGNAAERITYAIKNYANNSAY